MKNKGFTLIELLAVIVILAIIALIATPIILGIINDAKQESNKRSVDLYAKSIENQVARSQLKGIEIESGDLSSEFLSTVEYDGNRVICETNKLYSDGTVYLSGCTVGGNEVDYSYGVEKIVQDPYICHLTNGTTGEIGSEYTCSLDESRTFYVLENNNASSLSLIMSTNFIDATITAEDGITLCNSVDTVNNVCSDSNIDEVTSHIQTVFGNEDIIVSLPTYGQLNALTDNGVLPSWLNGAYGTSTWEKPYYYWHVAEYGDGYKLYTDDADAPKEIRPVITISRSLIN